MNELIQRLAAMNADLQSIINFTLLLLTLMLAGYVGLTNYELELARAAV